MVTWQEYSIMIAIAIAIFGIGAIITSLILYLSKNNKYKKFK